jgi:hypothetical protein
MSMALLLEHENGSFTFSKDPQDMQQGGIHDDDVLYNWTTQDTMIVSSSGLPFRTRNEIHLNTF